MGVVLTRVDARLIHGQVAVRWTKVTQAAKIVVVDNKTRADEFLSEILMMAAPRGVEVVIYNEQEAVQNYVDGGYGPKNTIIIFQNVTAAYNCWEKGLKFTSVNIGQSHKLPERIYNPNNTVHLSEDEMNKLVDLDKNQVEVYFHPTPEDQKISFAQALERARSQGYKG